MNVANIISVEKTPTSSETPLKNCFYIQYIVAQNIQIYFILYYFAQNKDFFSGVLQMVSNSKFVSVGVRSPTEINAPRGCAVILIGICQLL